MLMTATWCATCVVWLILFIFLQTVDDSKSGRNEEHHGNADQRESNLQKSTCADGKVKTVSRGQQGTYDALKIYG